MSIQSLLVIMIFIAAYVFLQIPAPLDNWPHLLIWSSPDCPLMLHVTFDPLKLLEKLLVLYTPFIIPWIAAHCVARQQWSVGTELLVIAILYGLTT